MIVPASGWRLAVAYTEYYDNSDRPCPAFAELMLLPVLHFTVDDEGAYRPTFMYLNSFWTLKEFFNEYPCFSGSRSWHTAEDREHPLGKHQLLAPGQEASAKIVMNPDLNGPHPYYYCINIEVSS